VSEQEEFTIIIDEASDDDEEVVLQYTQPSQQHDIFYSEQLADYKTKLQNDINNPYRDKNEDLTFSNSVKNKLLELNELTNDLNPISRGQIVVEMSATQQAENVQTNLTRGHEAIQPAARPTTQHSHLRTPHTTTTNPDHNYAEPPEAADEGYIKLPPDMPPLSPNQQSKPATHSPMDL